MRLIRNGPKIAVDVRNQILDQNFLECAEVESSKTGSTATGDPVRHAGASNGRSGVRTAGTAANISPVLHYDDEGLRFSFCNQVIHDSSGVALAAPAGFVFARAVL